MHNAYRILLATLALLGPAHSAWAADSNDQWQFRASIYGWLPDVSGKTAFPAGSSGQSVNVDADRILSNLDGVFMGTFEARKGEWGVFTDLIYMDLGNSKSASRDISFNGRPLPLTANANLDYSLKATVWSLSGTYRALQTQELTIDALAGFRYIDLKQTIDWNVHGDLAGYALPGRSGSTSTSIGNFDGIVGFKGRYAFGSERRWFVPFYFDIGTGESQLTTQAIAGLGYAFDWGEVSAAWRYMGYEMQAGEPIHDISFSGPAVGVAFTW